MKTNESVCLSTRYRLRCMYLKRTTGAVESRSDICFENKELRRMNITKVKVTPKSNRAKNKLANQMGGNPVCTVEQIREDGLMFLVSEHNKDAFMWVQKTSDDNWSVEKL